MLQASPPSSSQSLAPLLNVMPPRDLPREEMPQWIVWTREAMAQVKRGQAHDAAEAEVDIEQNPPDPDSESNGLHESCQRGEPLLHVIVAKCAVLAPPIHWPPRH
jgi:hypothetical protein